MKLDSFDVEKALEELRTLGAVSEVDWMGRSLKYRHQGYDWFGVNRAELAVMAELLLRGAQSLGDLRSRAARMEPIADLAALKPLVDGLVQRGLMIELTPAGRGQVVSHKVYTDRELAELRTRYTGGGPRPPMGNEPTPSSTHQASASSEALALLNAAVEDLRTEIASIREEVRDLARRFESRD